MMGRYISIAPRVKKQQVFTVSGTFTPSPGLLAAGGSVTVQCIGGGGGGAIAGGGSGENKTRVVTVTIPVDVIVGAGGSGVIWGHDEQTNKLVPISGSDGGTTSFGDLVIAKGGGLASAQGFGGAAGGEGAFRGQNISSNANDGSRGGGGGSGGGVGFSLYGPNKWKLNGQPNTGGGGGGGHQGSTEFYGGGNGGSGLCIVTWEE